MLVSAGLLLLAGVLSFPGSFGLSKTAQISGIECPDGYLLSAEMPHNLTKERGRDVLFHDAPVVCENGIPLARPNSSDRQITNAGRGRYQISGTRIHFSTSDGGPQADRVYTVRAPVWSIRESILLAVWLVALAATAIALRTACPGGTCGLVKKPGVWIGSVILSVALAAGFFFFTPLLSDRFFLGLLLPALWAVLMAALSMQKRAASRTMLLVLSLLPAVAGYFYYGLNAASDSSFLAGGIIPCSDARLHFQQAAEIAIQGTTQHMFNGRFLYPAFYAVILDLAGLNMLLANLLVSSLVMLGLALTCPPMSRRLGFSGTAIYCLLFWLYFRAHGCGLLMTENLGLLLGVIGFGFLLLSVDRQTLWPVFVSILFIGLASVARPGALFVLPALALYAGIRVWTIPSPGRFRTAAAAGAVLAGLAVIGACFGANHLVMKGLSRGETKTFGNFAFTLHGLLNGTKWSTSAEEFGWNTSLVMEHNIKQIQETPMCLVRGVTRAYEETFQKGFLFRFGQEKRFASSGMAMFLLALGGCWFWKPLRGDSMWILLAAMAILASIPFAPPWDAGERPYAATEPIQIFLAAAGVAMLLDLPRKLAAMMIPGGENHSCEEPHIPFGLIGFAAVCFLLTIPVPLLLKMAGYRSTMPPESPALLSGSQLLISNGAADNSISRNQYLDRLSDFQADYPAEARFFTSEPETFLLAIDWNNLEPVVLPVKPSSGRGE